MGAACELDTAADALMDVVGAAGVAAADAGELAERGSAFATGLLGAPEVED